MSSKYTKHQMIFSFFTTLHIHVVLFIVSKYASNQSVKEYGNRYVPVLILYIVYLLSLSQNICYCDQKVYGLLRYSSLLIKTCFVVQFVTPTKFFTNTISAFRCERRKCTFYLFPYLLLALIYS